MRHLENQEQTYRAGLAAVRIVKELDKVDKFPWSCSINRFIEDWNRDPNRRHFKMVAGYVLLMIADLPYTLSLDFDLLTFWSILPGAD